MRTVRNQQLTLKLFGPWPDDGFRFTWWNTREGAAVWVKDRGRWRPGIVIHRGRKYVSVVFVGIGDGRGYVRRRYEDLRRRVIAPRLHVLSSGEGMSGRRR